jgi:nitrous oxidase accessory protein NosD
MANPGSIISGCLVEDGGAGYVISNQDNLQINNCRAEGNGGIGFSFDTLDKGFISACYSIQNDEHGFYFVTCTECAINSSFALENSQGTTNTYDGIHLGANCDDNSVVGNTVNKGDTANLQRYGLRIDNANSDNNVAVGNDFKYGGNTANTSDAGTGSTIVSNAV